ncbi:MAG: hypothetical protein LBJ11_07440 [Oscillospiraceae bacterium]|jgi:hypothetical protein|nr:hypothetical protein [Oscillospiraceae bacterium]
MSRTKATRPQRPLHRKWWFYLILGGALFFVFAAAVIQDRGKTGPEAESKTVWMEVARLESGTADSAGEKKSEVFRLHGKSVKIVYEIQTMEEDGTVQLYLLKEGETKTRDASGNQKFAARDWTAVGSKTGEKILSGTKQAGSYYMDLYLAGVERYTLMVYEKQ